MRNDDTQDDYRQRHRWWRHQGPGNPFGDVGAWRMGLAQRGWLRPSVLRLLQDGPMNGIEIMNRMQELSHGWYRPSPGSIYPLLEQMEKEGLIRKNKDDKYEITKQYKEEYGPVGETERMLTDMEGNISYLEELKKSDKAKFLTYKTRVGKIADRLSKL